MIDRFSPGIKILILTFLFLVVSIIVAQWNRSWDVTSDKRYTLNSLAKDMARNLPEPLTITVYLPENAPPSFRNYQSYIDYYISELRRYDRSIRINYLDPSQGSREERNSIISFLSEQGIEPIKRQVQTEDELSQNLLYPYVSLNNSTQMVFVNLLEPTVPGRGEEGDLLASQLAFESKFLRALRRLTMTEAPRIHVIGHQKKLIAEGYNRDPRIGGYQFVESSASMLRDERESVAAIIACVKRDDLSREELLAIDWLSANEVPVLWLLDKFSITLDSMRNTGTFLAIASDFALEDYLFQKGLRIQPELVMDLRSGKIPQVTNEGGSNARTIMVSYPFHPVYVPSEENPVSTRTSAPVSLYFATNLESLEFPETIEKKALIRTSPYTQLRSSPVPMDFSWLGVEPSPEDYGVGELDLAVHLTGESQAYFKNRLTNSDRDFLQGQAQVYVNSIISVNQIIVGDADFAIPPRGANGRYWPVGYNTYERYMYEGNAQLISNLLESLVFGDSILALAHKDSSLTLLDLPAFANKKSYYYFLLLGLPLILLSLIYVTFHWIRRRKYAS